MAMREVPDLGILVGLAWQGFTRSMREHHESQGFDDLGRSDGFVFRALDGGPLTITDLAGLLEITKQGAAQIVDDMQARGYVQRITHATDGRARPVQLTARARTALAAARRHHATTEQRLVDRHGREAVAGLRELLAELAGPEQMADPRLRAM